MKMLPEIDKTIKIFSKQLSMKKYYTQCNMQRGDVASVQWEFYNAWNFGILLKEIRICDLLKNDIEGRLFYETLDLQTHSMKVLICKAQ